MVIPIVTQTAAAPGKHSSGGSMRSAVALTRLRKHGRILRSPSFAYAAIGRELPR